MGKKDSKGKGETLQKKKKRKRHEEDSEIVAKVIPREKRNKTERRQKANKEEKVKINEEKKGHSYTCTVKAIENTVPKS